MCLESFIKTIRIFKKYNAVLLIISKNTFKSNKNLDNFSQIPKYYFFFENLINGSTIQISLILTITPNDPLSRCKAFEVCFEIEKLVC